MSDFATGFLTGFMKDQADKISDRKEEAHDYFTKRLELAQDIAMKSRNKYKGKMDAALQVSKQLMGLGVPERVVMATASQNPDQLTDLYETVQKLQLQGVDTSDPGFYDDIVQVNKDFNPEDGENIASVLSKVYGPLSNNIKADPQSFDFDRKGTIWATLMGYNAMDNAMQKLERTPVLGDMSAGDVLRDWGSDDEVLNHPYNSTVNFDFGKIGDELRDAKKRNKDNGELTISQRGTITSQFDQEVKNILTTGSGGEFLDGTPEERLERARRIAAPKILATYPEAASLPEISRYLGPQNTEGSQSPSEPRTEPSSPEATPTPTKSSSLPDRLPSGATLVKDNGDGTSTWKRSDGTTRTYRNSDVEQLSTRVNQRPSTDNSKTPTPGWLDNLGKEYDE